MTRLSMIELLVQASLPAVGAVALITAHRRFKVADRNRLEDQFIVGAGLLDSKVRGTSYVGRTAGAVTLADLALRNPDEYDERVMRVFQSFLDFPPRYGTHHEKEGQQVDYSSIDTITIVEAIEERKDRERRKYTVRLTEGRPFRVNDAGSGTKL
jgi:hypothetical protein